MFLTKLPNGSYIPTYDADKKQSDKIKVGDEVTAKKARNPKFHRKGFALLKLGFDNQDKYDDFSIYRQVISMKAGFVKWVKGRDGADVPLPESIAFDSMTAERFEEWYEAIRHIIAKDAGITRGDIEKHIQDHF